MRFLLGSLTAVLLSIGMLAHAAELPSSEKKQTTLNLYATAEETYQAVSHDPDGTLFLDVRSPSEVAFLGMPEAADANAPYMVPDFAEWDNEKGTYKMVPNSGFTTLVEQHLAKKGLGKDAPIYLMCRSGSRSARAADLLAKAGYTSVYSVVDGYEGDKAKSGDMKGQRVVNGWKNAGLPWTYKIAAGKAYIGW